MKNSGAIVYWIDKAFCVQSTTIAPYELKAGATYESEATWKELSLNLGDGRGQAAAA
jgi:hypothetical protein